jgi:hypothetical protein
VPERIFWPAEVLLSFKSIVADYLWFDLLMTDRQSADSFAVQLDAITDLDPHFNHVYRYGALTLLLKYKAVPLAMTLLQKGLQSAVNQSDWRMLAYLKLLNGEPRLQKLNVYNSNQRIILGIQTPMPAYLAMFV